MPSVAVHFLLASNVLRECADLAELQPNDDAFVNAFLNGAVGPDMGYYPGGDPFITDLAHYIRSADLMRALQAEAKTATEVAYALGWMTHVMADVDLHPIVNQGVGQLLNGSREPAIAYETSPVAHVRVELGLDAYAQRYYDAKVSTPTRPAFNGPEDVGFVQRAYAHVYDLVLSNETLLRSHKATIARVPLLMRINRIISRRTRISDALFLSAAYLPLKLLTAVGSRRGIAYGATHTVRPDAWMRDELHSYVDSFVDRFRAMLTGGIEDYVNHNLDTGAVDSGEPTYEMARTTTRRLADLRATASQGSRPPGVV